MSEWTTIDFMIMFGSLCVQCFEEWEKILKLLKSTVPSAEKGTECEAAETDSLTDSTG